VSTTLAILLAYVVGYALSFPKYDWRYMLGVGAVPGVANLAVALLVPESSVWRDKKVSNYVNFIKIFQTTTSSISIETAAKQQKEIF